MSAIPFQLITMALRSGRMAAAAAAALCLASLLGGVSPKAQPQPQPQPMRGNQYHPGQVRTFYGNTI